MVGQNIRKFREQKNFTQEDLAEKLGVTRQAVSNWETEKTQPDLDTLQKIAQIFEISVEELIYGTKKGGLTVVHKTIRPTVNQVKKGLSFGSALAMVISYVQWESIGWAIIHGLLNWFYVIYFIIKYGWS